MVPAAFNLDRTTDLESRRLFYELALTYWSVFGVGVIAGSSALVASFRRRRSWRLLLAGLAAGGWLWADTFGRTVEIMFYM